MGITASHAEGSRQRTGTSSCDLQVLDLQDKVRLYNKKKLNNHLEYGAIKASQRNAPANNNT